MSSSIFAKIDKSLEEYYISMGVEDYRSDGTGKFLSFCIENGLDEDDIDEEFACDPSDCSYVEFDDEFPIKRPISNNKDRLKYIFDIIQYCYKYGKPSQQIVQQNEYEYYPYQSANSALDIIEKRPLIVYGYIQKNIQFYPKKK
eukprot:350470_1